MELDIDRAMDSMAEALRADGHAPFVTVVTSGVEKTLSLSETDDGEPFYILTVIY